MYDSGGYVQELGPSLEESRAQLGFLQLHNWIDNRWAPCSAPPPTPRALPRHRGTCHPSPFGEHRPLPALLPPTPGPCPCPPCRSRAVFVELTRYSPAVGLHAAVTLRLEFPAAGHAVAALSVRPFVLRQLSAGLSLPLLTSVGPALPAPTPRLWPALLRGSGPAPASYLQPDPALPGPPQGRGPALHGPDPAPAPARPTR